MKSSCQLFRDELQNGRDTNKIVSDRRGLVIVFSNEDGGGSGFDWRLGFCL
jgi:hypothetical protein